MKRLIPGRVRHEGVAFYEGGQVQLLDQKDLIYNFQVGDVALVYALDGSSSDCPCPLFTSKGYCAHFAAVEAFMKHEPGVQEQVQEDQVEVIKRRSEHAFASRFLQGLSMQEAEEVRYQLSAEGSLSPYGQQLWWTLKIQRLPDSRTYVVRDIRGFVNLVFQEGYYQIGKQYMEQLSLAAFDQNSQDLLLFLERLLSLDSQLTFPNYYRNLHLPSGFFEEGLTKLNRLSAFCLDLTGPSQPGISIKPLEASDDLYQFKVEVELEAIELTVNERASLALFDQAYLYQEGVFYRLSPLQKKLARAIKSLPVGPTGQRQLIVDVLDQDQLALSLLDFAQLGPVQAPAAFRIEEFEPSFELDVRPDQRLVLQVTLTYGTGQVTSQAAFLALPFASNPRKKAKLDRVLGQLGFGDGFGGIGPVLRGELLYGFFEKHLPALEALGPVSLSEALSQLRRLERPQIQLSQSGGYLDVSFDFSGLSEEDLNQALESLRANAPYFISQEGQLVVFDDEVHRVTEALAKLRAKAVGTGRYQLHRLASFQLTEALADYEGLALSQDLVVLAEDLAQPDRYDLPALPLTTSLRDYQTKGVKWLSVLDKHGFGGILADDMGLGKTLQTIAFLSSPERAGKRVLILAPSSLIYNWQSEFSRFYPQADVALVYGPKSSRLQAIEKGHDITLTSYHAFRQDLSAYQAMGYDYLILDEAQVLKNSQTKLAQALRQLEVPRCYALSGTPIENKLLEIWSIFQLILPGLFTSKAHFQSLTAKQVAKMIAPFVLRRQKEQVLTELPKVTEKVYVNDLTSVQKSLYLAQLKDMQTRVLGADQESFIGDRVAILAGLTRLRQICDSPALFMPFEGSSGKLESLKELLAQIKENGHRTLIFSQFRGMLDLIEAEMTDQELSSYKITGSTPAKERQLITQAFNKGSRDAVLISLKAGGVGLNLTGADTVVLVDLWWNPAVEDQAIGRAHRMGQDKPVQVYRLVTQGTIEEKILALQEVKRHLIKDVLGGQESRSSLTLADIREILGIS